MSWGTPPTHNVGDVLPASDWNIIADDVILLGASTGATVTTQETTTSTSYTNLTTPGPAVTLVTMTTCLVLLSAFLANTVSGTPTLMSFAVSGATTIAASNSFALDYQTYAVSSIGQFGTTFFVSGLTAGANTFTAKYAVSAGTGTYSARHILVIPLAV